MATKLRLQVGSSQIEYEGDEVFTKSDILELHEALSVRAAADSGNTLDLGVDVQNSNDTGAGTPTGVARDQSMDTIAQNMGVSSGSDLLLAALAYLDDQGKHSSSRKDVIDAMRLAKRYFRDTYVNNLTASIKTVVGKKFVTQRPNGDLALLADGQEEIKRRFGK